MSVYIAPLLAGTVDAIVLAALFCAAWLIYAFVQRAIVRRKVVTKASAGYVAFAVVTFGLLGSYGNHMSIDIGEDPFRIRVE